MERCPVCKARLQGAEECPRCGLELRLPLKIQADARALDARVLAALAAGDPATARALAKGAQALESTPLRARMVRFAAWAAARPPRVVWANLGMDPVD
jgi:hypothetical protein